MKNDFTPLESMMIDIKEYGAWQVWNEIDNIKNPIFRIKERNLFLEAEKRLQSEPITDEDDTNFEF